MVIVIMGDVESGRDRVGRLLAEYLGWEFAEVETLPCDPPARNALTGVDCTPSMKALYGAIDSLEYEWRDVVVSCSISNEKMQIVQYRHPLVKFVYLQTTKKTDEPLVLQNRSDIPNFGRSEKQNGRPDPGDRVLTVDPAQRIEQILKTVLSELILK